MKRVVKGFLAGLSGRERRKHGERSTKGGEAFMMGLARGLRSDPKVRASLKGEKSGQTPAPSVSAEPTRPADVAGAETPNPLLTDAQRRAASVVPMPADRAAEGQGPDSAVEQDQGNPLLRDALSRAEAAKSAAVGSDQNENPLTADAQTRAANFTKGA